MAPSSPSVQPATLMASAVSDGVDSRLFSTKKINILLDDHNYLLWHQQVLLAIKTYRLQHYINPSTVPPSPIILDDAGVSQTNAEFDRSQIWNALVGVYGSKSTSQLMFYTRALHSQRKADLSMREFLMKVKSFCDRLAGCGEIISEQEHVTAILNGFPADYESVVTIITASPVPYNVQGVTTMLLDAEARQQLTQLTMMDSPSSTNTVSNASAVSASNSPPSYRPNSNSRGRGRGRFSSSRVQCQLCGRSGHLVDRCYYRFDTTYKSMNYRPPPPPPQANMCLFGSGTSSPWMSSPIMGALQHAHQGWFGSSTNVSSWPNPFAVGSGQHGGSPTTVPSHPQALLATPDTVADNTWYPDSGATHHLTNSPDVLSDSSSYPGPGKCQVRDLRTREVLLRGSVHDGLYKLSLPGSSKIVAPFDSALCYNTVASAPLSLWHSRLGHPCTDTLIKALRHCNVQSHTNKELAGCVACPLGKAHKLPFTRSLSEYSKPLQLVVADVWGPAPVSSNGFRYYVAFTDAHSRYTWLNFLHTKSEVLTVFSIFHKQAERSLGCQLLALQTDGGGEFQALKSYLAHHGIRQRITCPNSSEQNGLVERKHRQIVEKGLSMLAHASMPLSCWTDAFGCAVYLINRLPSSPLGSLSPYEKLFHIKPNYSFLRLLHAQVLLPSTTPHVLSSAVSSSQVDTSNSPPLTASFNARQSASPTPITNSSPINSLSQPTHPLSAPLNSHAIVTPPTRIRCRNRVTRYYQEVQNTYRSFKSFIVQILRLIIKISLSNLRGSNSALRSGWD
ncbi:hypothetical protein CXB51_021004 [Gossypium anomalum]|uniref:Integrase catalytic domain-containing protein n=1 Tax=Gossypium anomalum TaxID=47600 RepID=A0A8J5YY35_9ROSI|nr:hypothetical protein CXB51_021004 [Gossypium anomalum]